MPPRIGMAPPELRRTVSEPTQLAPARVEKVSVLYKERVMSEFADDLQQSTKQKHTAPKRDGHNEASSTPVTSTGAQPSDAVLTKWMGDTCSGPNAPMVCAPSPAPFDPRRKAEPAPPPFDTPVPIGMHSVAPPAPMNWAAAPSIATCPSEMITGQPTFKPAFQSENLETYKAAFTSSWSEVRTTYNGLVTLHRAFKDKEKEIIPILQVDPSRPVGAGLQGVDAGKSFVGGQLKPSLTKMDSSKLPQQLRAQIFKAQDKSKQTELDVANKRDLVTNANTSLVQAAIKVEQAASNITIVQSDAQIQNLQLDKEQVKRDLEDFKAKVKATVESVKLVTSIINCWAEPSKVFGNVIGAVNQAATAGGAIAEASYTVDANAKLANLDGQLRSLTNYKAGLQVTNAEREMRSAMLEVDKKVNEAKIAVRSLDAAKLAHREAYREMGVLMEKAGAASGLNPKDRKAVAGAVEAVPKIELIQQQLQGMDDGLQPPPYNEASGIGAAMASNVGVFTHALSVVKGNREYVGELKALWVARRASVLALVDKTVSVTGDE
jgi:hypothetical protein